MDERVQLAFLKDLPLYETEKPYSDFTNGTGNIVLEKPPMKPILDIRGREREFTLAIHGFEYREHALPVVVDWEDENDIKGAYVEDLKEFMKKLVPETVQRCEMFDFRVRLLAPAGIDFRS